MFFETQAYKNTPCEQLSLAAGNRLLARLVTCPICFDVKAYRTQAATYCSEL